MKVLDGFEKEMYDLLMADVVVEILDCWDLKAPEGFENHIPLDLLKV